MANALRSSPLPSGCVLVDLDTGALTFIDGMAGELGLGQRLHLIGLLYTSTRYDRRALAQSVRSVSEPFPETNPKAFDANFAPSPRAATGCSGGRRARPRRQPFDFDGTAA
jgi:hypothetical protein